MTIQNLKTGSKFQLVDDLITGLRKYYEDGEPGFGSYIRYPKGLVLSLVNMTIKSTGNEITFKVIRAKPIIKRYYQDIKKTTYIPEHVSWYSPFYNIFRLRGEDFTAFIEGVENGSIVSFDAEYETLTKTTQIH